MNPAPKDARRRREMAAGRLLAAVPCKNQAADVSPLGDGALVTIPTRRPRWLVPPLSWILPWRPQRRVQLDAPGAAVLALCDGQRNVEQVIETFAREHKLSFRESQLAVTQFLRELLRRGIIAVVGT